VDQACIGSNYQCGKVDVLRDLLDREPRQDARTRHLAGNRFGVDPLCIRSPR
jgi:hypothetical protein